MSGLKWKRGEKAAYSRVREVLGILGVPDGVEHDGHAGRDLVAAQHRVLGALAAGGVHGVACRVEPQRLLHEARHESSSQPPAVLMRLRGPTIIV